MKIALTLAASLLAASSFVFAADNNNGGKGNNMPRLNDSTDMKTDDTMTGSIKCDNSNADVNSGCDKPGHLKQEERMQEEQQQ